MFKKVAGFKKQGAGLAACPLKNPQYRCPHLENSSSRPRPGTFKAALIDILHLEDKRIKVATGNSEQKYLSLLCLDRDQDLGSSNQLNLLTISSQHIPLFVPETWRIRPQPHHLSHQNGFSQAVCQHIGFSVPFPLQHNLLSRPCRLH